MTYSSLKALLVKRFDIPKTDLIRRALRSFTPAEKAVFYFLVGIFAVSGAAMLLKVNNEFLVEVPISGGSITEGVIGNPRFINPVLAISEADKNLVSLVYSGLIRINAEGDPVNDLAENITVSEDGLIYTATIRPDAVFHDGAPVTAEDVVFTIEHITNPGTKSPYFATWSGITAEALDEKTVQFQLKKAYAPFIENLSQGILPKHIWQNVTEDEFSFSQFNVLPVGSGLYKIATVERNSGGIPDYYDLELVKKNSNSGPYISHLIFKFYPSETDLLEAFSSDEVESISGISPEEAVVLEERGAKILSAPLPRIFGVFFNESQSKVLLDKTVRQALDLSAPRQSIVSDVLYGYGTIINSPIPRGLYPWVSETAGSKTESQGLSEAIALLEENGWTRNEETGVLEKNSGSDTLTLSFSISTGDTPELKAVAEKLRAAWEQLGAKIEIEVFGTGDLNQNVIRPRRYDALLFGEAVGRDADVYPFWHSSQRNDPGLNIAMYANSRVDKLLEDARSSVDNTAREEAYRAFDQELKVDIPAVFLYSPNFLYVVPKKINKISLGKLSTPQDRFLGIHDWYIETNKVWEIFIK